ncbi:MAG: Asp23/Gls24 family envelope stress response protein [Christensenellales bacterium]|jgi:uncharacterized alkaline shock family protein YloU
MAKVKASPDRYGDIIASITAVAIFKVEGVASLSSESGKIIPGVRYSSRNKKSIQVYIVGDKVTIDVFINVYYGYNLPDLAFNIQEKVKNEVMKATHFVVDKVNINVLGVVFPG